MPMKRPPIRVLLITQPHPVETVSVVVAPRALSRVTFRCWCPAAPASVPPEAVAESSEVAPELVLPASASVRVDQTPARPRRCSMDRVCRSHRRRCRQVCAYDQLFVLQYTLTLGVADARPEIYTPRSQQSDAQSDMGAPMQASAVQPSFYSDRDQRSHHSQMNQVGYWCCDVAVSMLDFDCRCNSRRDQSIRPRTQC